MIGSYLTLSHNSPSQATSGQSPSVCWAVMTAKTQARRPLPSCADHNQGYTPRELARLLRVSPDRVRAWIVSGEMQAINTARVRCGRPRYVILPHHLREWEERRRAAPPKPPPRRPRRQAAVIDYYPD